MNASSSRICSILDIPDEILVKIILHFNARKRLPLAKTCTRFNNLIFGDKELMRDLDFSKKGRLVKEENIQQYFNNKVTCRLVIKVNIQNVNCMKGGDMLNNTIGKATNLVELNIYGTKFKDIEQLGSFLEPLVHLKRLSINWPEPQNIVKHPTGPDLLFDEPSPDDLTICCKILHKPLSRLKYLSAQVCVYSKEFLPTVQECQELEQLDIVATPPHNRLVRSMLWNLEPNEPKNLKIVRACGWQAVGSLKDHLVAMVPDRSQWTDFQLIDIFNKPGFYLEKNVEVCEELQQTELMRSVPYLYLHEPFEFGWFLLSECLLREVIRITHEDTPEKFCCLTPCRTPPVAEIDEEPCLLKIEEAKQLLRDPGYPISFLHFKHSIEPDCDAHLVASAFPYITELVLSHIVTSKKSTEKKMNHFAKRLRRRYSTTPQEYDEEPEQDSSFKMFIKNTPHVRDLTIFARNICDHGFGRWDLDALYLIPLWKNLTTLRLAFVPVKNGNFLIHIGKECPQLNKLILHKLGFSSPCCYTNDLPQMLSHCQNLKEFSINQGHVNEVPEILISLSNNLNLRSVRVINATETYNSVGLITSIEKLLHNCPKLNTFVFIIHWISNKDTDELTSALRRIRDELNRPKFQFQTTLPGYSWEYTKGPHIDTVYDDASNSFFPCKLDGYDLE